jgi:AraC-like DNA-binding protein
VRPKTKRQGGSAQAPDLFGTHALLAQSLGSLFVELRLAASLTDGTRWRSIHPMPENAVSVEWARGAERKRGLHNTRSIRLVRLTGKSVVREHSGFFDLFVPIGTRAKFGVLVAGPFALRRPTSSDLLSLWRELTGSHGRATDPEFVHFVNVALETATFSAAQLHAFQRALEGLCQGLAGEGELRALALETEALLRKVVEVRFAERIWDMAREMIDPRFWRGWHSPFRKADLTNAGLTRVPVNVAVGLLSGKEGDLVDGMLNRDAFLRATVELLVKRRGAISGRVGDHGVTLLTEDSGPIAHQATRLRELGERVGALARRHGFRLHLGLGVPGDPAPLPRRFQVALGTAEKALSEGVSFVVSEPGSKADRAVSMADLRSELARAVREDSNLLSPRFDRYIEVVAVRTAYRLEPFRMHLEAGFEKVTDVLRASGALDDRSFADMQESLERVARAATVREVAEAYRGAVSGLELLMTRPTLARQDRNLRRAIDYMREHLAERLTLARVARIAGFAPGYFSTLLSRTEHATFRNYLSALRLARAKQMLVATILSVERVGQLCGFPTRSRFHRAFRQSTGLTPDQYRKRSAVP